MVARRARAVRVYSDRPLRRLTVLWLKDRGSAPTAAPSAYAQPAVLRRADWGADESLRFGANGTETWPSAYYPVQKLIVHHTATQNNDPNPAATIRSIYYYPGEPASRPCDGSDQHRAASAAIFTSATRR